MGFLFFGGDGVARHYAVRLALAWERVLPFSLSDRRLIGFLDAMSDRILLTRVGGGWVFIHRLLLEFLAREPFGSDPATIAERLRQPSSRSTVP